MISLLPLLAAGFVPFVVGSVWYHPRVFGAAWMRFQHITPEMTERSARRPVQASIVMLGFGIACAAVLARILAAFFITDTMSGILAACMLWLGLVVPTTVGRVVWDHVPVRLYLIETGQWLISLILMATILLIVL